MTFKTKRGRPKKSFPSRDVGTPELIQKRLFGATAEALDLCLERGLITPSQHSSGMHLRWLYTLRYGAVTLGAQDFTRLPGVGTKERDAGWIAAREREYRDAVEAMGKRARMVEKLCVFGDAPSFLSPAPSRISHADELYELCNGLEILSNLWQRGVRM